MVFFFFSLKVLEGSVGFYFVYFFLEFSLVFSMLIGVFGMVFLGFFFFKVFCKLCDLDLGGN